MILGFSFIGFLFNLLGLAILTLGVVFFASGYTGTHVIDWFRPSRWKAVLISLLKKFLLKLGDKPGALEAHEIEQFMGRILACSKCVANKCVSGCGCKGIDKMNVRGDYCSLGRWGTFMSYEDWESYKKEYNVKFSMTINNTNIDNIETDGYNTEGRIYGDTASDWGSPV